MWGLGIVSMVLEVAPSVIEIVQDYQLFKPNIENFKNVGKITADFGNR